MPLFKEILAVLADKVSIELRNTHLVNENEREHVYYLPVSEGQPLDTLEMIMNMSTQNWLVRYPRILGSGIIYDGSTQQFEGDFILDYGGPTAPGDTLFLDLELKE